MKFRFTFFRSLTKIGSGVIDLDPGSYQGTGEVGIGSATAQLHREQALIRDVLAVEQAVNGNTAIRLHVQMLDGPAAEAE